MVVPQIKKQDYTGKKTVFPTNLTVSIEKKYEEMALKMLKYFLPQCKPVLNNNALITTIKTSEFEGNPEKYQLKIENDKITVKYGSYISLRNAFSTLSLLVSVSKDGLCFPICDIEDYPVAAHRSIMLDLARGIKNFETLKQHIILIAKAKMNYLHLHLADSIGVCFKMKCLPESYHMEGAYTEEQINEIITLTQILALEIIPEFDMPAHSTAIIKAFPDFCCDVPGKSSDEISHWAICAGTEEIYGMYEKIIKEIARVFPGKYFHIGGDELEFGDLPEADALCYWSECTKCKALCERELLKDRQELYYYFIKRIYGFVKAEKRQMIMWSDQVDCIRPVELPQDIIMQFWRVAEKGRGPIEGCSMNAQLKMGYTVINSYYPETYFDLEEYMSSKSIADWHWQKKPECDADLADRVIGGELCGWEYGNTKMYPNYDITLPSAVFLMADKLWNGERLEYTPEYSKALTKSILGAQTPENLDVFSCIGDVLPPRNADIKVYSDKITASKEEILYTQNTLKKLAKSGIKMAEVYADAITTVT